MTRKYFLEKYYYNLMEQYYLATGDNQANLDYIIDWFNDRKYMLDEYALSLEEIKNYSDRWEGFLNNTVEVGNIGKENTVSEVLSPISIISPCGFMIDNPNSYVGDLAEQIESENIDTIDFIRSFDTFISHNPNFRTESSMLGALKSLAWQFPTVSVSVYGSLYDNDRKQKLEQLKDFMQQIITHHGADSIGKVVGPIVRGFYKEGDNDTYVGTIITDQYAKTLLPDAILQSKLRNLSPSVSCARHLAIESGRTSTNTGGMRF